MKKSLLNYFILCFGLVFSTHIQAQSTFDLNGNFEGYREVKIDSSKKGEIYLYQYNLNQEGNTVTGTSTIYDEEGHYAEVQFHGVIVENKLYFEEYGTLDQINPKNDNWCYESGQLDISLEDGKIILSGRIKSFSKNYGFYCANSFAYLEKESGNNNSNFGNSITNDLIVSNVNVSPNPMENISTVFFTISDSTFAIIEVYDLEGELVLKPLNRNLLAGSYSFELDLSFHHEGMYIVELILDRKIYSTELYKMSF